MTAPVRRQKTGKGPIDFEQAQFDGSAAAETQCAQCHQAIASSYYTVNKQLLCESCKERVTAQPDGSAMGRFLRAILFGTGAAALGAGLWYAVTALTGYEFGLIAIVVGFLVGAAVRVGSSNRGGLRYQLLAVFLTYTSIVSTNVPLIINELKQEFAEEATPTEDGGFAADESALIAESPVEAAGENEAAVTEASVAAEEMGPAGVVVAVLALMALAYALPFLAGFQNILGILIIAFGLWQAWRMNARQKLEIAGPFHVSSRAA